MSVLVMRLTLFLASIDGRRCVYTALQDTVRQTFGECGDIKSVRFAEDRETGEFRGFGHVEFYDGDHVDAAMALANTDVMGRPIRVSAPHPD